jgi:hypothetical protein
MALADVTKAYVDLVSYGKYATRTTNTSEFEAIRLMQSNYLNSNASYVPDDKYTHGLALLICHYYALDDTKSPDSGGQDTSVGPITTERVGRLTQTRGSLPYLGTVEGFKTYLLQTKYGTEFLFLMGTFKSSPSVT